MRRELLDRFARIEATADPNRFRLDFLVGNAHLSRASDGAACIVFELASLDGATALRSQTLLLDFHRDASVVHGSQVSTRSLAVLACKEPRLLNEFAVVAADAAERLREQPASFESAHAIREFYRRWSQLFREPRQQSSEQAEGLWGELRIIESMPIPDVALDAWLGPEGGTHDFAANMESFEVKTSRQGHVHSFGLQQLDTPANTFLTVASLHVVRAPAAGTSVADVLERLASSLEQPLLLEQKIIALGFPLADLGRDRFELVSLRFYDGTEIPRPRQLDPGVRRVHFEADLSQAQELAAADVAARMRRLCGQDAVKEAANVTAPRPKTSPRPKTPRRS